MNSLEQLIIRRNERLQLVRFGRMSDEEAGGIKLDESFSFRIRLWRL